ncbi:MAG: group II intron reverse transcriptase/maturase, partial [Bacteroidales bacterium]|nr:group II intron reverse transcriptase/maturase [Bacteroidales bacterium]MDD3891385.1 group II intron reverse transcriptase/maturase [Bacteroidales bacterium]
VLDELDKELVKRGHCFVHYADDSSIYVRSQTAGERVNKSISAFIINVLVIKINGEKSMVCDVDKTVLLGRAILKSGDLVIAKENVDRFKNSMFNLSLNYAKLNR